MNTERDRLINWAKQLAEPNWCLSVPKEAKDVITQLVQALEPRQVTTVEELDALQIGSVVLSEAYMAGTPEGGAWKVSFQRWYDGDWHRGARSGSTHPDNFLPATVLHEGTL